MGYTSQQTALLQTMITYLQDSSNWPDGDPKVTDFTPGSVAYTILAAIAVGLDQISKIYYDYSQQANLMTATGTALDNLVQIWGVTRKQASAAVGTFTFSKYTAATTPITIPEGILITTVPDQYGNVIQYLTNKAVTLTAGNSSIQTTAICQVPGPGIAGNLAAGTPLLIGSALPGIDAVSIGTTISNGMDKEADTALRARCLQVIQNPQGGGTVVDYKNWALAVTGVTTATVIPLNRGPGTIDIVITAGGGLPTTDLITLTQVAIDEHKPVNADVKVLVPTTVTINITASTTLASGYTTASITTAVQEAITNYVQSVNVGGVVYSSGMTAAVIDVQGVLDCQITLSVSGITMTNVVLQSQEMAVTGTMTIS